MQQKPSLREKQKLATRRHIQDVARNLIAEHGYEKTTMRALAREAGVGLGTISLHFKDKRSLLLASFHEEIGAVSGRAIMGVPKEKPVRDQLLHIISEVYAHYGTNTKYLRAVVKEALFAGGEWGRTFDAQIKQYTGLLAGLLEQAKERGELRIDLDSGALAMVFWSIYLSVLVDGLKQEIFVPEVQVAKVTLMLDVLLAGASE